jgi:hypothetical protein
MEFLNKNYPQSTSKVYKTATLDLLSMSSRGYATPIEVPQSERGALPFLNIKSHDIKNFLPSYDMLPLSFDGEPDIIIPIENTDSYNKRNHTSNPNCCNKRRSKRNYKRRNQ